MHICPDRDASDPERDREQQHFYMPHLEDVYLCKCGGRLQARPEPDVWPKKGVMKLEHARTHLV